MTGENRHGKSGRGIYRHAGLSALLRRPHRSRPHRAFALAAAPLLAVTLASCTSGSETISGSSSTGSGSATTATTCGAEVTPIPEPERQINLVLDESGSMFVDSQGAPSTLWSIAKYSLEVFAALISPNDTLNVFPMSEYTPNAPPEPTLRLPGTTPPGERVQEVHDLVLNGRSTPWRSVTAAVENILRSPAPNKWLVVLTDGQFVDEDDFIPSEVVVDLLDELAAQDVSIAFMSIGREAAVLPAGDGRIVAEVQDAGQLLSAMTGFANTIFERSLVTGLDASGSWATDIPMAEVVVFAQGEDVAIGDAATAGGSVAPTGVVPVSWTTNPDVEVRSPKDPDTVLTIRPVPDESLEGLLASYSSIPAGSVTFDVSNASQVDVFYKPDVEFGYFITDTDGRDVGNVLTADTPYTLNYSFMDSSCAPIASDLLNPVQYTAEILRDGEVFQADIAPGASIQLPSADYELRVAATYTGGSAAAVIPLIVSTQSSGLEYFASQMSEFPPTSEGIPFRLSVTTEGTNLVRPPTSEEWAALDASAVTFDSTSDLDFQLVKGSRPGEATILVRAPDGDVYAATTGEISVTVTPADQGALRGQTSTPVRFKVIDDISGFDRFMHWFWTVGIWILVALFLLVLLLGYLMKKRFPRRLKKRPTIEGIPRVIGQQRLNARGQFDVNGLRRLLPFVADTGTLKYVPAGTMGFRPMQVKAGPRKMLRLTNWKEIAKQSNVQVNGSPLDETTIKEPMFGASAMITADTPQMSFEMTPSQ
mgnify:CR=1 FL=1